MRVELRNEAKRDLRESAWFYEMQRENLGDYFYECLFEDLDSLNEHAGIHEKSYGLFRKQSQRFPFAIYYQIEDATVDVVAIIDCRRNPDDIQRQLDQRST